MTSMGLGRRCTVCWWGMAPFPSGDVGDVLNRVRRGIFPAPRRLRRSIDPKLEAICLKAMALKPEDRHASPLTLAGRDRGLAGGSQLPQRAGAGTARGRSDRWPASTSSGRRTFSAETCRTKGCSGWRVRWRISRRIRRDRAGCADESGRLACEGEAGRAYAFARSRRPCRCVQPRRADAGDRRCRSEVRLWDVAKGGLLSPPIRHAKAVRAIAFSPDGRLVATASDDGAMRQWDAMTGAAAGSPRLHGAPVTAVCFSPDGSRIATASGSAAASLWEARTGHAVGELGRARCTGPGHCVPSGRYAVGSRRRRWRGTVSGDREGNAPGRDTPARGGRDRFGFQP